MCFSRERKNKEKISRASHVEYVLFFFTAVHYTILFVAKKTKKNDVSNMFLKWSSVKTKGGGRQQREENDALTNKNPEARIKFLFFK